MGVLVVSAEARLHELGIELPEVLVPKNNYVPFRRVGPLLYITGRGPAGIDGPTTTGRLGADLTVPEGYAAARTTGLHLLAVARLALGTLDGIISGVHLLGMVRCTPEFEQLPQVVDGCSDVLVEVLGDAGRHTRSCVGMSALPFGIAVQMEATFEVS